MNSAWTVCEQYVNNAWTVTLSPKMNVAEGKKKKKTQMQNAGSKHILTLTKLRVSYHLKTERKGT